MAKNRRPFPGFPGTNILVARSAPAPRHSPHNRLRVPALDRSIQYPRKGVDGSQREGRLGRRWARRRPPWKMKRAHDQRRAGTSWR